MNSSHSIRGWHFGTFPCTCKHEVIPSWKGNTTQQKQWASTRSEQANIESLKPPASPWYSISGLNYLHTTGTPLIVLRVANCEGWQQVCCPAASFPASSERATLGPGCFQRGRTEVTFMMCCSCGVSSTLFLISQPCNPVWHKDGCCCWLPASVEQRTSRRQIPISARSATHFQDNKISKTHKIASLALLWEC